MGMSVLIVEDDRTVSLFLNSLLEREGFVVDMAATGQEALQLLSSKRFDLMLLDLRLPDGFSGEDVLDFMNRQDLKKKPGVFVYSAVDNHEMKIRLFKKGVHEFFLKPFIPDSIVRRMWLYLYSQGLAECNV